MNQVHISIIIPTRNREAILSETLEKAENSIRGKDVEIIVINDGNKELTNPYPCNSQIRFFKNTGKGVSCARNLGAYHSKGEILFFIDDDMWITSEAIEWIDKELIQGGKINAVYNINWEYPPVLKERLKNNKIGRYILSSGYHTMWGRMGRKGFSPSKGSIRVYGVGSCSLVMPRRVFNTIGAYNEDILFQGEDIDLSNRINTAGIPIYALFDITLYHNHEDRLDFEGYFERLSRGYQSQFFTRHGRISTTKMKEFTSNKIFYYRAGVGIKKYLLKCCKLMPNNRIFTSVTNRIIGTIGGIIKYQEWKRSYNKCRLDV